MWLSPTSTLTAALQENNVRANLKRDTMVEELLKVRKPKLMQL